MMVSWSAALVSAGINSKLPASPTDVFFTLFEDQEAVEIKVFQGEDPDALKNVEIGTFLFSGLNEREGAQEQGLLVTYRLDLDGLLHVHARERATGRELRGVVENAVGRSTDEALGEARERVSALWGEADRGGEADAQDAGPLRPGAARSRPRRRPPCPPTWSWKSRRPWRAPSRRSMPRRPRIGKR